jgi:hypothetical protein
LTCNFLENCNSRANFKKFIQPLFSEDIGVVCQQVEILDCPIWVLIINVVAMEMLRSKLPPLHVLDNRYLPSPHYSSLLFSRDGNHIDNFDENL